jgi:subtilisin family serine protease
MERARSKSRSALLAALLAVSTVGVAGAGAQAPDDPAPPAADFAAGRVIVRYVPGTDTEERRDARRDVDATSSRALDLSRTELLRLPAGQSVQAAVAELESRGDVEFAQPDWTYQLEAVPNDPGFSQQWGLNNTGQVIDGVAGTPDADIDAPEAWDITPGSDGLIVGVIDSGVNVNHPDLAPNIFVNQAENNGTPGVDDDGNGAVDDVRGFDFVNNNGNVADDKDEHGTLVASVVGARGNNALGVTGVAQQVRVLPLQARAAGGGINTSAVVNAVAYGRAMGARVINMSFGSFGPPDAGDLAIQGAVEASPGVLFSTSAGNQDPATGLANDNDVKAHWPSNLTTNHANVIATANTTNLDVLSGSSSFGATTVDLAAPGNDILGARVTGSVFSEKFDDDATGTTLPGGWTELVGTTTVAPGATTWSVTNERSASSPNSLTDSPGSGVNYANNSDTSAVTPSIAIPTGVQFCQGPHLRRRRTEAGADFLRIGVSISGGAFTTLQNASGNSAGDGFLASEIEFDITGPNALRVRFQLQTDSSIVGDGVHIDDIEVRCGPLGENYRFTGGTSFAAPATAAVAALLLSRNAALDPAALKNLLRSSVDPVGALAGKVSTAGRLNAAKAVTAAAPPPPPPPPPDRTAALISSLTLSPVRFLPLRAGATVRSAALRRGSRLSFRVNELVRARVQIYSRLAGRRVGRRCLRPTRARRRRPRCTRFISRGVFTMPGQLNGLVRRTFSGRLRGRALKPGPYRLTVRANDLAGNRSVPRNKNFTIAKAPRPRRRR